MQYNNRICIRCNTPIIGQKIADSMQGAIYEFACRCGHREYEPKGDSVLTPYTEACTRRYISKRNKLTIWSRIRDIFNHPDKYRIYSWKTLSARLNINIWTLKLIVRQHKMLGRKTKLILPHEIF